MITPETRYWNTLRTDDSLEAFEVAEKIINEGIRPSNAPFFKGVHLLTHPTATQNYFAGRVREMGDQPRTFERRQLKVIDPLSNKNPFMYRGAKLLVEISRKFVRDHASRAMDVLLAIEYSDFLNEQEKELLLQAKKRGIVAYVKQFEEIATPKYEYYAQKFAEYRNILKLDYFEAEKRLIAEGIGHPGALNRGFNSSEYDQQYGSIIVPQALIKKEPYRFFGEKPNKEFFPAKYYITDGLVPPSAIKQLILYDVLSNESTRALKMGKMNSPFPIKIVQAHL